MTSSIRLLIAASIGLGAILTWAPDASAFKPEMHIRATNVAMYDTLDGGICLPGLSRSSDPAAGPPEQVWMGNTELQHVWTSQNDDGSTNVEYRTWIPQYAPMMRAGAIGPDGFPDPLIGQLFVHDNHAEPTPPGPAVLPFQNPGFERLFDGTPPATLDQLAATLQGKPAWRSIDWGHEVLYRALNFRADELEAARQAGDMFTYQSLREARRPGIAFALGYLMHMIGDGQIHALINETVGKPWGYTDTTNYENGYYRWLSPLQEELQHMGIERYLHSRFFPGDEAAADRALIDGGACAPMIASGDTRLMCIDSDDYIEPPVSCEYCNPLRGGDPSVLSDRCDHCFDDCNPWKELCTPTVPEGVPHRCDDVCLDLNTTQCDEFTDPDVRDECITKRCANERAMCICNDAVDVLTDIGVLPDNNDGLDPFLCTGSTFGDFAGRADRIAQAMLTGYQDAPFTAIAERRNVLNEAKAGLDSGACGTEALDALPLAQLAVDPANRIPEPVTVTLEDGSTIQVDATGPEIDLNENGEPDLINECVMLNCRINPHSCPWNGLDRDLDERSKVDIRTCFEPDLASNPDIHGEARQVCDATDDSPWAVQVDSRALLSGDPATRQEAARQFMNSSYIEVPRNFVAETFYMDRLYFDETAAGTDPQPGDPGTYSLGGYPVNAVHVTLDALRMVEMWVTVAITRPLALLDYLAPNSEAAQVYSSWVPTLTSWIDALVRVGDEFYNSPILNFTIEVWVPNLSIDIFSEPFVKRTVTVDIGKRIGRGFYQQAGILKPFQNAFNEVTEAFAGALTSQIALRRVRLEQHLREGWVEATTCAAETVANGAHRSYSIDKFKDFARDAVDILVTGQAVCQRPNVVDAITMGDLSLINFGNIVGEFHHLMAWFHCQLMDYFFGGVLEDTVITPLEEMLEQASEQLFCDTLLSDDQQFLVAGPDELDKLRVSCTDIHTILWSPEKRLTEPSIQAALQALDYTIELANGESLNVRDYVRRMRAVTVGTCWDGMLSTTHLTPRNQMLAAFGDSDLRQDVYDEETDTTNVDQQVCPLDWPWIEPGSTDPAPPEAEFVDTLDGMMDLQPAQIQVVNDEGTALEEVPRDIMRSAAFMPAYNAIQLSKLAMLGPGQRSGTVCYVADGCDTGDCMDCRPPDGLTDVVGGVRSMIDRGNAVSTIGSGDLGWRPLDELFYTDASGVADGTIYSANSTDELTEFFRTDYIGLPKEDGTAPGRRRCADLNWNLMCNSIYNLDDPDDFCRHAAAWSVAEGFGTPVTDSELDACVWRAEYENPCDILDGVYDDYPMAARYKPDPQRGADVNEDPWMCNVRHWEPNRQGAFPNNGAAWPEDEHWDSATPHQRSFWIDASRKGFVNDDDTEHGYGYNLTRFPLANKDTHVTRLYSKVFSPFYCPTAGKAQLDDDCDGVPNACDNCSDHYNPTQHRSGYGAQGDACADGQPVDRRCSEPVPDIDVDGPGGDDNPVPGDIDGDGDPDVPVITCNCAVGAFGETGVDFSLLLLGLFWLGRRKRRR